MDGRAPDPPPRVAAEPPSEFDDEAFATASYRFADRNPQTFPFGE